MRRSRRTKSDVASFSSPRDSAPKQTNSSRAKPRESEKPPKKLAVALSTTSRASHSKLKENGEEEQSHRSGKRNSGKNLRGKRRKLNGQVKTRERQTVFYRTNPVFFTVSIELIIFFTYLYLNLFVYYRAGVGILHKEDPARRRSVLVVAEHVSECPPVSLH